MADYNDLAVLANRWLVSGCSAPGWCSRADIDGTGTVEFRDYALFAKDWSQVSAEHVLLQTIYGTAQDLNGNITANNSREFYTNLGTAMALSVPADTTVDKAIFKCYGIEPMDRVRLRLYNVTGLGYLQYGHTMSRANPGGVGNDPVLDILVTAGTNPVESHTELGDGKAYTDMVIDFASSDVTGPGEYLITFDPESSHANFGMVRGLLADTAGMGKYPDGNDLPKRATVTTSSSQGNTYYYQLGEYSSANYIAYSNLFSCQFQTE